MREVICGIYKITNKINGKVYIGQAHDIYRRWYEHNWCVERGRYPNILLYRAINKYGISNFKFEILDRCSSEELNGKEIEYIAKYKSYIGFDDCWGYNMTTGGEGNCAPEWTEERKKLQSEKMKGRSPWNKGKKYSCPGAKGKMVGEKNPFYGHHHTEATKEKLREARLGKIAKSTHVICENKEFSSITECCNYYNIKLGTMSAWLKGDRGAPEFFIEAGLETIPPSKKIKAAKRASGSANKSSRKVICVTTNVVYDTIKEACEDTGANINTVISVCKGKGKTAGHLKDGTKLVWRYYEDYLKGGENVCKKK